jgi:lipopolysaccharide/colanic/teichoic acid biosynthesis glycosyltransferase
MCFNYVPPNTTAIFADTLDGRELPDLSPGCPHRRLIYLLLKRVMDLIVVPILTCVAWPVVFLAAVLIKLETKGPAFFIQKRVRARYRWDNGRIVWTLCTFRCYKLRTMYRDADQAVHKEYLRRFRNGHLKEGPKIAPFKLSSDSRVTRVGKFLRRTSLDELPQLLNVIKGEMSLVGPRPVPVYEVELYDQRHYSRLAGPPGITGMWQVYGRSRVTFEEMMWMDIEYVRRASIFFDIKLLLLTITSVLSLKGAA